MLFLKTILMLESCPALTLVNPFTAGPEYFGTHFATRPAGPEYFGTHTCINNMICQSSWGVGSY